MNQKFSFKRFTTYAASMYSAGRKNTLIKALAFVGFCMAISFLLYIVYRFHSDGSGYVPEGIYAFPRTMSAIAAFFLIFMNLSGSFRSYHRPAKASALLMLPVSKAEKFTYALVNNVILAPIFLIAVVFLNDALWSALLDVRSMASEITLLDTELQSRWLVPLYLLSWTLASYALFFLGSVFFRRNAFLFTILSILGFLFLLGVFGSMLPWKEWGPFIETQAEAKAFVWKIFAVNVFWMLVFIVTSWKLYCKLQINK